MNITSLQNPRIKDAIRLRDRRHRDREGLTLVEGRDEVLLALAAGADCSALFLSERALERGALGVLEGRLPEHAIFETSAMAFAKLAYRENPDGWLAVVRIPALSTAHVTLRRGSLVLVVDGAEKPGNVGAMARTADAAGADALVLCGEGTDPWNPNAIRASRGAVFALPVLDVAGAEALAWIRAAGLPIVAADPDSGTGYASARFAQGAAIVVGAEHAGLSAAWREAADETVRIPMGGRVNSLNVSTAAAILLYEAVRQRV